MHVESAQLLRFGQRGIMCSTLVQLSLVRCGWDKGREKGGGANAVQGLGDCVLSNERTTAAAMSVVD